MTATEVIVVVGGVLVGYWVVAVFMPAIIKKSVKSERASNEGWTRQESVYGASDQQEQDQKSSDNYERASRKWFEVLEVSENASREKIVAAYKLKMSQYHPDKVCKMGEEIRQLAEAKSKEINAAYVTAIKFAK